MSRAALAIPTLLSALRLVLTVPAALAILRRDWHTALAVSVFAGLTDSADGWIARRFGLITRIGAWADPVADKVLLVTIYLSLGSAGAIPAWLVWLVLGRDVLILAMAAGALAFTPLRDFPPSLSGKVSTVLQVVTAVAAIGAPIGPPVVATSAGVLIWCTGAAAVVSGAHYFWSGVHRLREVRAKVD